MEERGLSIVEHEGFSVQGETHKEIDREVCGAICDRRSSINKCGGIVITIVNEDSSGSQCEQDSAI